MTPRLRADVLEGDAQRKALKVCSWDARLVVVLV